MSETVAKKVKVEEPKFSKQSLLLSRKLNSMRDVVNVVLEDGVMYTMQEVEDKINAFLKGGNK